jgi:hypothetical protein
MRPEGSTSASREFSTSDKSPSIKSRLIDLETRFALPLPSEQLPQLTGPDPLASFPY